MRLHHIKNYLFTTLKYILLIAICAYLAGPLYIILVNALKTEGEISQLDFTFIPRNPTFANLNEALHDRTFLITLFNSFKIAVITTITAMCISLPAAYALERIRTKGTKVVQGWILLSQMIPLIAVVVPLFVILKLMRLTNTHLGQVLIYTVWALPIGIWLTKGFVAAFPAELGEAAYIDGCSKVQMFVKVLFPILLPGLVTSGIFVFIRTFNEYFFALCLLKTSGLHTFPLKLNSYIGLSGQARAGMLAIGSVIATIPGLFIFSFFQKYYVQGLTSGAVKG